MNYSIRAQSDRIMVESWASSRRRIWGSAIAIVLLALGGAVLYLKYAHGVNMSLSTTTAAASFIGFGLGRAATDFGRRECVTFSTTSARRTVTLLGFPTAKGALEFSHAPTVSLGEKGIEVAGTLFRFGKYLSREDSTAIVSEINGFLESTHG